MHINGIDIVIPVYKPDDKFRALLKGLAVQTVRPDKIIIMYTRRRREIPRSSNLTEVSSTMAVQGQRLLGIPQPM